MICAIYCDGDSVKVISADYCESLIELSLTDSIHHVSHIGMVTSMWPVLLMVGYDHIGLNSDSVYKTLLEIFTFSSISSKVSLDFG